MPRITFGELATLYMRHARTYYRHRDGSPTGEHRNIQSVLNRATDHFDNCQVDRLTRHAFRAWMDQLVAADLSRPYVNACLSRLRRVINWANELDYVNDQVVLELRRVRPLPAHRSAAREPVAKPLPQVDEIAQIIPHLPPVPRAVVQLLVLTGARVGELLVLEQRDLIEIDDTTWAIPRQHKNTHRDHVRRIPLDARCLSILEHAGLRRPLRPVDPVFPSQRSPERPYTRDAIYGLSRDPDATARANIKKWQRIRGKRPDAINDPYRRTDAVFRSTVLSRAVPPPCSHVVSAANVFARTGPPARSFAAGATGRSDFKEVAFQSTI